MFSQKAADGETEQYNYMYLNDGCNRDLGFANFQTVVMDGVPISPIDKMFGKVEDIGGMGDMGIVLTDHGFWDIEPNSTGIVTYAYDGRHELGQLGEGRTLNSDATKLVSPELDVGEGDKVSEIDRTWRLDSSDVWRLALGASSHPVYPSYPNIIKGNCVFKGGGENVGVYSDDDKQTYLIVGMVLEKFREMLFSIPSYSYVFTTWLYGDVTMGEEGWLKSIYPNLANIVNGQLTDKVKFNEPCDLD